MPERLAKILAPDVGNEYLRWLDIVGKEDPYTGTYSLGIHDVLKAHFLIADHFYALGKDIGGIGPKSVDLLHSALSRQHVQFDGKKKWTDKYDICATLMYGLVMNHPFHDANKRTAFLSSLLYLYRHKQVPVISHQRYEDFTVEIADGALSKYSRYKEFSKSDSDPEVRFISHFLRRNTRAIDRQSYTITYDDLDRILRTRGYGLENADRSFIDVIRYGEKRSLLGKKIENKTTVCRIAYPGGSRQVASNVIKYVREKTGLTEANGCDSQTFYYGVEDMQELIAHYRTPLRNLAAR